MQEGKNGKVRESMKSQIIKGLVSH
jgi:hypothetical protein